ncbi:GNAT family N-acetyltransferase [Mesorhizobium sp. M1A.F.Ca.ET.072.01.1.1]|uniref:GNAT family N-acetyltransferase n=1 Tax=Mesorhizobium sp. M1A.F.Ca.ET.072.01.1.1 TaxID=2496753 RepID=UPI000FD57B70|nr:GNAT family N-acetyltransferase [Mesorhizobium sp. M1A.F.Ca.ET.072.01.1.1]RUW46369.1 GNAT family N-acetyltransferase [Mesorhizobium sp. M1A.F.Ca.ET.072.01.1.1]TIU97629.1 MAG: GNAT family N-acetyltransferase [Mesorhizobium sp.]
MAPTEAERLPAFPSGTKSRLKLPPGVSRAATLDDIHFLRRLYWSFRLEEMEPVAWPQEMKRAFIDQQFDLQHRHYVARFSSADFLILLDRTEPVGRLYVDTSRERWHVIDIGLFPQWRNRGKGMATLKTIQRQAKACSASGIMLHVERRNIRAQALYRRLHFHEAEAGDTHIQMQWSTR